ncbi:MAG: alpha-L-rhamnosidase, partial [Acidobacteria bacterium]|nr:alpha-L-rhamnosidase [Acidobacteriota bacterium]
MISRRGFLLTAASLPPALTGAPNQLQPTGLQCEYAVDPLGLDTRTPRFSWQLSPGMQSAWQVLVASGEQTLWDSGKVVSAQSAQVAYAGRPLGSRMRCQWKVRVWDEKDAPSPWSAPAWFELALLEPSEWRARW